MSNPPSGAAAGGPLHAAEIDELSLYIHVPFCSSRCNYCDFYFETTRSPRIIELTLDRILEEAQHFLSSMGSPRIRTVYFGGGTPSVVPPDLLDRFLRRLRSLLTGADAGPAPEAEWSIEANPESTTDALLDVLVANGVNRLSLGIQSFDDNLLRTLTRRADHRTVVAALERIAKKRAEGAAMGLNVDLITGIPGQSSALLESDVKQALDFGVDHFSVYSLTVEEHTPLKQAVDRRLRVLPTPERQDRLWLQARDRIVDAGFEWYEISNFARPGRRSQHNLAYWRLEPYLGLGPGGVSTLPMSAEPGDRPRVVRLTNPNLFIYASKLDRRWHHSLEPLEPRSFLFEHFITGLRTSEGVSLERLEHLFGLRLVERWSRRLADWAARGIIDDRELSGSSPRLILGEEARLALDHYLLEIDDWIEELRGLQHPAWPDRPNA